MAKDDYLEINRRNWDERAPAHAASVDYALSSFIEDPSFLSAVVRFDQERLGDLQGLDLIHLQCHIGTDTISLARLGARVTGVDFSPAALQEARRLSEASRTPATFVEADVYSAVEVLGEAGFDLLYTGIGALCWLPDITRWAKVVAGLLRPGGRLFLREGHPMLLAADEAHADRLVVSYPYFEREVPSVFDEPGTYVRTEQRFHANLTHEWNHGLGQLITALLEADMTVTGLVEHDSVPWEALPGQMSCDESGEWRLTEEPWRLAASYTLQARRT